MKEFPSPLLRLGPLVLTDVVVASLALSLVLVGLLRLAMAFERGRRTLEIIYGVLEAAVHETTGTRGTFLVPLVLTQWLFIGAANLLGLVPGLLSPTRDLSLAVALAAVAFLAGHVHAAKARGLAYLAHYVEPNPLLLPFNVIGELSRTLAMALRLFGNMLSATLIGAIVVSLAGLLLPVPLMLLGVLTAIVQAYIFGMLTLAFAASSVEEVERHEPRSNKEVGAS